MGAITLSEIYIYPVKSLAGIALESSELEPMGLRHDRRWMVVDPAGNFITQRTHPQMALIQPRISGDRLIIATFGMDDHEVRPAAVDAPRMEVKIWADTVNATRVGEESDRWLSQAIGDDCRLVYIPDDEIRHCDPRYADPGDRTGFTDGYPLLLVSQASLDDLNQRLAQPVEMRRFRPNLVVTGTEPYAEDNWQRIRIGKIEMRVVKPCSRCAIPTVDPDVGETTSAEPLQTLATYRQRNDKVYFGQNMVHNHLGQLHVGDALGLLE